MMTFIATKQALRNIGLEKERGHWVVTTYLNGKVSLYDSKLIGKLPRSLEEQICKVYQNAVVDDNLLVAVIGYSNSLRLVPANVVSWLLSMDTMLYVVMTHHKYRLLKTVK